MNKASSSWYSSDDASLAWRLWQQTITNGKISYVRKFGIGVHRI
jgi:hypothetical protein